MPVQPAESPVLITAIIAAVSAAAASLLTYAASSRNIYVSSVTAANISSIESYKNDLSEVVGELFDIVQRISKDVYYIDEEAAKASMARLVSKNARLFITLDEETAAKNVALLMYVLNSQLGMKDPSDQEARFDKIDKCFHLLLGHARWAIRMKWDHIKYEAATSPFARQRAYWRILRTASQYHAYCSTRGAFDRPHDDALPL